MANHIINVQGHCILNFKSEAVRANTFRVNLACVIRSEFCPASELITFAMNVSTCEMVALIRSWFYLIYFAQFGCEYLFSAVLK